MPVWPAPDLEVLAPEIRVRCAALVAVAGRSKFAEEAPQIAEVFVRRHTVTGNLCLLATLRSGGYPRISSIEPRIFEGRSLIVGMPAPREGDVDAA